MTTTIEASSTMTDKELLRLGARANGQREKAWEILYRRLKPAIMGQLIGDYGVQESVAEDLAQGTFARMHRHAHRHDQTASKVRTWAIMIAQNLAKNEFRTRSRDPTERYQVIDAATERDNSPWVELNTDPSRTPDPEEDLERSEIRDAVEDAVEELPPIHKVPMRLRLRGYSYQEIAEITGIKHGTVKSRLNRARRQLRPKLGEKGIDADLIS